MSKNDSPILRILALPVSIIIMCLGVNVILGGHITPGGGFQGGAMISAGLIMSILVYGMDKSPIKLSHNFISGIESFGALVYLILGLLGLLFAGSFLYNIGGDFYNIVPNSIQTIFNYPDVLNAGIIPYLNISVGIKVMVGLTAIVIAFYQFKSFEGEEK